MGLLRPSFVPPPQIRALRLYTRQLLHLTADRTRYWQRLEKLLESALCKLTSVVSRLAGHRVRPRDDRGDDRRGAGPAGPRRAGAGADAGQAPRAGRGVHRHAVRPGARLQRRSACGAIDLLDAEITPPRTPSPRHLAAIPAAWGVDADGATGPDAGPGRDAAVLPAVGRLDEIPGVSHGIAAGLIAEIGLDMSRFPTPDALVSWAGLAPVPTSPGPARAAGRKARLQLRPPLPAGRQRRRPHGHVPRRAAPPHPSRPGGGGWKKACIAVGRSILVIVWHLLERPRRPLPRPRPGPLRQAHRHQPQGPRPQRQLEALGYDVISPPARAA